MVHQALLQKYDDEYSIGSRSLSSFSSLNNFQCGIDTFLKNKKGEWESKITEGNIHGSLFSHCLDGRFHGTIKELAKSCGQYCITCGRINLMLNSRGIMCS